MPSNEVYPRKEYKNVPISAHKQLKAYAAERGVDMGEAFGEAVAALKLKQDIENVAVDGINSFHINKINWEFIKANVENVGVGLRANVHLYCRTDKN